MKMRSYLKKNQKDLSSEVVVENSVESVNNSQGAPKHLFLKGLAVLLLIPMAFVFNIHKNKSQTPEYVDITASALAVLPEAATASARSVITIPSGMKKEHPFVPYRKLDDGQVSGSDVPSSLLVEPPEELNPDSDAARLMDTIVSGILYDKYSPSAILNIEGTDYLVKKGDVVNNYKVLSIKQDSVTVKLGTNTYKAGIGEILTEGTLNHNEVSNLSSKFGGGK